MRVVKNNHKYLQYEPTPSNETENNHLSPLPLEKKTTKEGQFKINKHFLLTC